MENKEKPEQPSPYLADIWSDTVDLRHLGCGMLFGVTVGLSSFIGSHHLFMYLLPDVEPNLVKAYALLGGLVGSLIAAVIVGIRCKPKRTISEAAFSEEDRLNVIKELQLDINVEAEELKTVPPEIVAEMKQLKIYDLFSKPDQSSGG